MEYRQLGKWGVEISELSLGSWITFGNQIEDTTALKLMKMAYDNGINFFDNAEVYAEGKSEEVMGKHLKKLKLRRDTYLLSSKVFWGGQGPNQKGLNAKRIREACEAALRRLQVEYLDFFFCHRPDERTPIEETVYAMNVLIQQGKILYWGTSEWSAQQIMQAWAIARENHLIGPRMEQPQYNMLVRDRVENEYRRLYTEIGLGTTIWSPLASGILSGKYNTKEIPQNSRLARKELNWLKEKMLTPENIEKAKKIAHLAKELGCTPAQLAIAWCLKNPHVSTVILGATRTSQLKENLKSIRIKQQLSDEIMNAIETVLRNKPVITTFR